jgi:hypothetical protein
MQQYTAEVIAVEPLTAVMPIYEGRIQVAIFK